MYSNLRTLFRSSVGDLEVLGPRELSKLLFRGKAPLRLQGRRQDCEGLPSIADRAAPQHPDCATEALFVL